MTRSVSTCTDSNQNELGSWHLEKPNQFGTTALCLNKLPCSMKLAQVLINFWWLGLRAGLYMTDVEMSDGYAAFSGGALHTELCFSLGPMLRLQILRNTAGAFAGGFNVFAGADHGMNCSPAGNIDIASQAPFVLASYQASALVLCFMNGDALDPMLGVHESCRKSLLIV